MNEIWKDVKGFEGLYQVSNLGRVRSLDRRKNNHFFRGRILRQPKDKDGYCLVTLNDGKRSKMGRVHRLVALAFIPNPENLPEVNHIDENKENNRIDNLEWCTTKYNLTYGSRKGMMSGTKNNHAKLTEKEVVEIRKIYKEGDSQYGQSALGKRYGVSHIQIANIVNRISWPNISE